MFDACAHAPRPTRAVSASDKPTLSYFACCAGEPATTGDTPHVGGLKTRPTALVMVADETCGADQGDGVGFAERLRVFLSRCIERCPHVEGPTRVPGR